MKAAIEVKDRAEAQRIQAALTDETARAYLTVMGALLPLSRKARLRVLEFVSDSLMEETATGPVAVPDVVAAP